MEDFIYIILAIVWLVVSIIGGKKKKKQAQEQQQPQPHRSESQPIEREVPTSKKENDFEDLLEDFFGSDTPKKQPSPEPVPQRSPQPAYTEERSYDDGKTRDYRFGGEQKAEEVEKFEGVQAIEDDFEFTAEGKVETLEDLIKTYQEREQRILEEDAKIDVVELDEEVIPVSELEFDARKAIIYSEIINRKYS